MQVGDLFQGNELPGLTQEIARLLSAIAPEGRPFCQQFQDILAAGAMGKPDALVDSQWSRQTCPLEEAFLHARFFL